MELDGTSAYKTVLFIQKVDEVLYVRKTMTEEYFMRCILPLRLSGAAESIWITDGGSSSSWNEWRKTFLRVLVPEAVAKRHRQKLRNLELRDSKPNETFFELIQRLDEYNLVGYSRHTYPPEEAYLIQLALDAIPDDAKAEAERKGVQSCETLNELRAVFAELDEWEANRHKNKVKSRETFKSTYEASTGRGYQKHLSFSPQKTKPGEDKQWLRESWKSNRPEKPSTPCRDCGEYHWRDQCKVRLQRLLKEQTLPAKKAFYMDNLVSSDDEVQGYCAESSDEQEHSSSEEAYVMLPEIACFESSHQHMGDSHNNILPQSPATRHRRPVMLQAEMYDKRPPVCADSGTSSVFISLQMLQDWFPNVRMMNTPIWCWKRKSSWKGQVQN
jgi:hypothetical protein